MENKYFETGQRILKLRSEMGISRERLAESADISVQFLADIEKGRKNMTVTTVRNLASALNVTTDHIINGRQDQSDIEEEILLEIFRSLSHDDKRRACEIVRLFAEAARRGVNE